MGLWPSCFCDRASMSASPVSSHSYSWLLLFELEKIFLLLLDASRYAFIRILLKKNIETTCLFIYLLENGAGSTRRVGFLLSVLYAFYLLFASVKKRTNDSPI